MTATAGAADPYLGRSFGNVTLSARIGQGGMGMVYRGQHGRIGREVAVKLLPPHHDEQRLQYQQRFLREGQTAARIHHRNVIQVLDAGSEQNVAYLVLEFVDGRSLGSILDQREKLPAETVEKLALDLAEGLTAVHAAGVVHRDIKPDNLLLGSDGVLKIADLGLARQLNDPEINRLTATGMVVGTPLYVAPEAIRDAKNADAKADIYGMGATLYHMLVGRPPFTGKTPYDVMRAHLDQRPEPLREIDAKIPRHLANLVHLCLSKDPTQRPSASEIARILRARHTVRDGAGRSTMILSLAAMVAVVSLAVLAWQFVGQDPRTPQADPTEAASASIFVRLPYADVRYRLDGGEWRSLEADRIPVSAGEHQIQVEVVDNGRVLRDHSTLDVASGDRVLADLDPAVVAVPPMSYRFPIGSGLLFVRGQVSGSDERLSFQELGEHPVTRFDGRSFWNLRVRVDENDLRAGEPQEAERPGDGFFTERVDGLPTPRHHLATWQEVEWARARADVLGPGAWSAGAERPSEPALGLDHRLIAAVATWASDFDLALPDRSGAETLYAAYRSPIWYREDGRIGTHGSPTGRNALVVLVPVPR